MDNPASNIVSSDDCDKLVKLWIFGERGVGKRALVQKFVVSYEFLHFAGLHKKL